MNLVIVHANEYYDPELVAKQGIDELCKHFNSNQIIELTDLPNNITDFELLVKEGFAQEAMPGYVKHNGTLIYSKYGYINKTASENFKEEKQNLLTGGYLNLCLKTALGNILAYSRLNELEITLVGEAIFTKTCTSECPPVCNEHKIVKMSELPIKDIQESINHLTPMFARFEFNNLKKYDRKLEYDITVKLINAFNHEETYKQLTLKYYDNARQITRLEC